MSAESYYSDMLNQFEQFANDARWLLDSSSQALGGLEGRLVELGILIKQVYVAQLFCIGAVGAIIVCFILYKFIKSFY